MNYTSEEKKIFSQAMSILHDARRRLRDIDIHMGFFSVIVEQNNCDNVRSDIERAISLFEKIEP